MVVDAASSNGPFQPVALLHIRDVPPADQEKLLSRSYVSVVSSLTLFLTH